MKHRQGERRGGDDRLADGGEKEGRSGWGKGVHETRTMKKEESAEGGEGGEALTGDGVGAARLDRGMSLLFAGL